MLRALRLNPRKRKSKLTPEQERLTHQRMLDAVFGPSEHIGKTHRSVVVSDVLPFRQDDDEDLRGEVTFDES
jgi:hypothetical protein